MVITSEEKLTEIWSLTVPGWFGMKVMVIPHDELAARLDPQVVVSLKVPICGCAFAGAVIVNGASVFVELFVTVTVWVGGPMEPTIAMPRLS